MSRNFLNAPLKDKHVLSNYHAKSIKANDLKGTNFENTSSFLYDGIDRPIVSTQQLNVDWSNFENHVFFSPATVNVNVAFDKIINGFPFNGTKKEVSDFFEKLSGYENWVYEQFPKYRGSLHFSGTQVAEDTDGTLGTFIKVNDSAGVLYPAVSKMTTGESLLGQLTSSWAIEMQLFVPSITTNTQSIIQKLDSSNVGYSLYLDSTTDTSHFTASLIVHSGSTRSMSGEILGQKGQFEHICYNFVNSDGSQKIEGWLNESLQSTSNVQENYIGTLNSPEVPLLIGSGSTISTVNGDITFLQTFSGSIDELRIFSTARSQIQQQEFAKKSIFSDDDVVLYYKFNEPSPPLSLTTSSSLDSIVIDSSGNSFHSHISNFKDELRVNADTDSLNPLIYEKSKLCPVVFPGESNVVNLNVELLNSASLYDEENPNLITRLFPPHYFEEGQALYGLDKEFGSIVNEYTGSSLPGSGKLGNSQLFATLLYTYAKFFDDMKLYVDSFSSLSYVNYDDYDTCPDNFLIKALEAYGFDVPPIFSNSTFEQYVDAENTEYNYSTVDYSFKYIQAKILRRLLTNIQQIIRSKGTQHSIKSFLRSIGIDPNTSLRIREYGGPTQRTLDYSRENRFEPIWMLTSTTSSLVKSPYLSGSRVEVGYPHPSGTMVDKSSMNVHGISNGISDGLFTSGSWTLETTIDWKKSSTHAVTESIMRLCTTGSNDSEGGFLMNVLAVSSSLPVSQSIHMHVRTGTDVNSQTLKLELPNVTIFDGDKWTIGFGRIRNDDPSIDTTVSSSFFLRVGKQLNGELIKNKITSSFHLEAPSMTDSALQSISSVNNPSGTYFSFGPGQTPSVGSTSGYTFLNNTVSASSEARVVTFSGRQSHTRFWSKYLTDEEWSEHVLNYKSTGVTDPTTNWSYITKKTGSFERLRIDSIDTQTDISSSALGSATIIDYSGNDYHLLASNYDSLSPIFEIDFYERSAISSLFDEFATDDKVRIRSFLDIDNINDFSVAGVAPVYEPNRNEIPNDDCRFSIEFSLVDALNRDIISIFSTLDEIDDAIGSANLMYSVNYPKLENLRDVYFNRLVDKLNFKAFFEFFKWFDVSLSIFVEQLVPKKTIFKGVKYMVESHILERHKIVYPTEAKRQHIKDRIHHQDITSNLKRY